MTKGSLRAKRTSSSGVIGLQPCPYPHVFSGWQCPCRKRSTTFRTRCRNPDRSSLQAKRRKRRAAYHLCCDESHAVRKVLIVFDDLRLDVLALQASPSSPSGQGHGSAARPPCFCPWRNCLLHPTCQVGCCACTRTFIKSLASPTTL